MRKTDEASGAVTTVRAEAWLLAASLPVFPYPPRLHGGVVCDPFARVPDGGTTMTIAKREKVWGLTPRWDGTQGFTQWAQIIVGSFFGLLVLVGFVGCGVEEYRMARDGTRYEVTYIEIADGTKVKCMYDRSWDETFACEWPTR